MSRRRSHCNSRISGEEPAREPDSKRPVDVPISPRPRPSGPGVQCRPVQSSLITGLHHPMAGNSNRTGAAAAASQDSNSKTCQLDQPNARLGGRDLSQLPTLARQSCTPTRFLETSKKHIAGSFNLVWVPGSLSFHAVPAFPPFPSLRNLHLPRVETRTHLQNLRRKHPTDPVPHPPPSPKTSRCRRPCIQTAAHACIIPSSRQHFPTATTAAPSNAKDHKRRLLGPSRPGEALYSVTVGGKSPLGRIMYVVSLFLFSWKSRCYASVVQCHGEDTATPGSSHAWRDGTMEKIRPP